MSTTFPLHTESFMLLDSGCLTNSDYFLPFALTDVLTTFQECSTNQSFISGNWIKQ